MTIFKRRGYWRTSIYGVRHWVGSTMVARDDWDRNSYSRGPSPISRLWQLAATKSLASAYVNPNATCPVCGEPVFFYQNEFGSKVYFDDLGPPWPKHPCTDNAAYYSRRSKSAEIKSPALRDDEEITEIQRLLRNSYLDPAASFAEKHRTKPWAPYRVEWCKRRGPDALLILVRLDEGPAPRLFLRTVGFSHRAPIGTLVYYARSRLSYFAQPRAKVREVPATRVRGARKFVEALLEFDGHSA